MDRKEALALVARVQAASSYAIFITKNREHVSADILREAERAQYDAVDAVVNALVNKAVRS